MTNNDVPGDARARLNHLVDRRRDRAEAANTRTIVSVVVKNSRTQN